MSKLRSMVKQLQMHCIMYTACEEAGQQLDDECDATLGSPAAYCSIMLWQYIQQKPHNASEQSMPVWCR